MKNPNNIATIVAGLIVTAGLTVTSSANAAHMPCTVKADSAIKAIKENGEGMIGGANPYGKKGEVSPDKYDQCVVSAVELGAKGYTTGVIKRDPLHAGGTVYYIRKKPKLF